MSKRPDTAFLDDIKEAIIRINIYLEKINYTEFSQDRKTQDAVVRNIEIIGEAVKNISETLKSKYPQMPWKELAKVRDRLIHHYFGVNYDIVWDITKGELPIILPQIEEILEKETKIDKE